MEGGRSRRPLRGDGSPGRRRAPTAFPPLHSSPSTSSSSPWPQPRAACCSGAKERGRREGDEKRKTTWDAATATPSPLLSSYDIGVTGGVTSMPAFLHAFFPGVATGSGGSSLYCRYASPTLQLFTSSLFLAGLVSSLAAAFGTRRYGRKASLLVAGGSFMVGAAMTATAGLVARARGAGLAVLVAGRLALGVGVGFGNQAAPLVLNECAPAHLRGAGGEERGRGGESGTAAARRPLRHHQRAPCPLLLQARSTSCFS